MYCGPWHVQRFLSGSVQVVGQGRSAFSGPKRFRRNDLRGFFILIAAWFSIISYPKEPENQK